MSSGEQAAQIDDPHLESFDLADLADLARALSTTAVVAACTVVTAEQAATAAAAAQFEEDVDAADVLEQLAAVASPDPALVSVNVLLLGGAGPVLLPVSTAAGTRSNASPPWCNSPSPSPGPTSRTIELDVGPDHPLGGQDRRS